MCTLLLLFRPGHPWPVILGANRDEMRDRAWDPPGRHWPQHPEVIAGRDRLSGGSWLGLNRRGLVAAVLNRRGSLGPEAGKRSRGELVLKALEAPTATAGAEALARSDPEAYRSFNLVLADRSSAFWLRHQGPEAASGIEVFPLPQGLSLLTAGDRNDPESPRIRRYLPRLKAAPPPDPERDDWAAWQALLADRGDAGLEGPSAAMNIFLQSGFGTVSSSLIALPQPPEAAEKAQDLEETGSRPLWLFAAGRPDEAAYEPVILFG